MPIHPAQLRDLARVGAAQRLAAIRHEMDDLVRLFPELRGGGAGRRVPAVTPRTRRAMSGEERATVAARMRRYWAERRASAPSSGQAEARAARKTRRRSRRTTAARKK
jgi:hypothetical protein